MYAGEAVLLSKEQKVIRSGAKSIVDIRENESVVFWRKVFPE